MRKIVAWAALAAPLMLLPLAAHSQPAQPTAPTAPTTPTAPTQQVAPTAPSTGTKQTTTTTTTTTTTRKSGTAAGNKKTHSPPDWAPAHGYRDRTGNSGGDADPPGHSKNKKNK